MSGPGRGARGAEPGGGEYLRPMAQRNVEIVRGIYAEWGRGNFRAGTDLFDPDVVLVIRADFPDAGAYAGREQIGAYMRNFLATWTDAVIEAEEIRGAGDRVAVAVHQEATGSGSGLSIDMRYWQVWTFRDGAVIRIESIRRRSEVDEALGPTQASDAGPTP